MFKVEGKLSDFVSNNIDKIFNQFKEFCDTWNINYSELAKHISYIKEVKEQFIGSHTEYINIYFDNVDYFCILQFNTVDVLFVNVYISNDNIDGFSKLSIIRNLKNIIGEEFKDWTDNFKMIKISNRDYEFDRFSVDSCLVETIIRHNEIVGKIDKVIENKLNELNVDINKTVKKWRFQYNVIDVNEKESYYMNVNIGHKILYIVIDDNFNFNSFRLGKSNIIDNEVFKNWYNKIV